MKEIKYYWRGEGSPQLEDLEEAKKIATENNCIVSIKFYPNAYNPICECFVEEDSDIEKINEKYRHTVWGL